MKYLVKKWKRATRVGSPVVTGQINHQHGRLDYGFECLLPYSSKYVIKD